MKYIDAEELKASVQEGFNSAKESEEYDDDMYETGRADAYEDIIHIIDSLQQEQPEADLEKELDRYLRGEFQQTAGGNFNNYIQVARHFYELGKNGK